MSTHLSAQQVEAYRLRRLPPAELLDAGDHLATCAECRKQVAEATEVAAALSPLRKELAEQARAPEQHLSYEQLAGYVDDQLNEIDREIADSHLFVCAPCKEELRDLYAFKETLAAAAPVARERRVESSSFGAKISAWLRGPTLAGRWQFAAAALVLLFAGAIVWLALRPKEDSRIAVLQPPPTPSVSFTPSPLISPAPTLQGQSDNANVATPTPTPEVSPTASPQVVVPPPIENQTPPLLVLNDNGGSITLDRAGNLAGLDAVPQPERRAVRDALIRGRLETPASLSDLRGKSGTLMGGGNGEKSFFIIGPAGTIVRDARPTFRWHALEGATSYTIKIYDTGFNLQMTSEPVNGTEWTPGQALAPGKLYSWQVVAMKEGREVVAPAPPAPEARFRVLDRGAAEDLTRSLTLSGNSHLARGVLFSRAGLLDEAEREFTALAKANPQSSVARKLLNNVRALRRSR